MFFKRILPITIILVVSLLSFWRFQNPCVENVDLTYQNGWQGSFEVKVERKPESCSFGAAIAGANYTFSARQDSSQTWQEVITIHYDDPIEIPSNSVRVFNENTAYVFMGQKYAVTNDKGINWKVWDVAKDMELNEFSKHQRISKVTLTDKGFGIMTIHAISNNREIDISLLTRNFGETWEHYRK